MVQPESPAATTPAGKAASSWVTRADAVATLTLAVILAVWLACIVAGQYTAGRDIRVVQAQAGAVEYRVDVNAAGAPELMLLPGVGAARANRIIAWRNEHGPFTSLEYFRRAAGLSGKDLERIKGLISFSERSALSENGDKLAHPESP